MKTTVLFDYLFIIYIYYEPHKLVTIAVLIEYVYCYQASFNKRNKVNFNTSSC